MTDPTTYRPGLEGVVAGESAISRIDVERNRLIIRGYDLVDLTTTASFEEVAYLLLNGELPNRAQLDAFLDTLRNERSLPEPLMEYLRQAPDTVHPMSLLRTAVSALSFWDPDAGDNSPEANVAKATRLLAKAPTILTTGYRLSQGQEPVPPHADLSAAGNLLYMLRGEEPAQHEQEAINVSLILYAEHGYNASAFAARVVTSTLSDLHSAVTAGIGALSGPLHGGANEQAMQMLLEVEQHGDAEGWVLEALALKKKIMGFGHREYKAGDSRVPSMKAVAEEIAKAVDDHHWVDLAARVEETMIREKGIHPNVDFPCSYTYYMMGIPIPLYTPIFVSSRIAGWSAHVIEQLAGNRLIRPAHIYTGQEPRPVPAIDER
jgi:citrate synthase